MVNESNLPICHLYRDHATTEAINISLNVLASPTNIRLIANSVESNVSPSAQLQSKTESELCTLFRSSMSGVQSINNRQTMPTSSAGEVQGPR